ncbi:phage holin, LLH family [Tissierella sp.]|uniref:phage holin, LLH family n=1 Tax=Tissierella sp. TaxID=41274 RepID=UPI00285C8851|nr:phage holin, LLH family [Tissierella sp.]MDR7856074.1 phage holin, LLH family [Tissierella sp.]
MNGEAIVSIGTIVFALIGAFITYTVRPYINANTTEKQRDNVVFWVKVGVSAAEQMKNAGILNIPKKEYVIEFLNGKSIDIDLIQLDALIEAAVFELNKNKTK